MTCRPPATSNGPSQDMRPQSHHPTWTVAVRARVSLGGGASEVGDDRTARQRKARDLTHNGDASGNGGSAPSAGDTSASNGRDHGRGDGLDCDVTAGLSGGAGDQSETLMTHRILRCYIGLVCGHFEIWLEGDHRNFPAVPLILG
jgi:hypothetical protein